MRSSFKSPCKDAIIRLPTIRSLAILSGSATQINTNRNSRGAWIHDVASKRFTNVKPLISDASIKVAPRSKNPSKPPVNNENTANKRTLVPPRMRGSHRTLAKIAGYRKESRTGTQLFKNTSSVTATRPRVVAARRGLMARVVIKNIISSRSVAENAISKAPVTEPTAKASSVSPNALSTNLMANPTISAPLNQGVEQNGV